MPADAPLSALPFSTVPHTGLEHNPRITVLSDVVHGGPLAEPTADRRWVFDRETLRKLLVLAEASPEQRVVIHHGGVRVRRVLDGWDHPVEMLYVIGTDPKPLPHGLGLLR